MSANPDYWSESFDSSKECASQLEVRTLEKESDKCRSVNIGDEDEKEAFNLCKTYLSSAIQKKCETTRVEYAGKLLYCKERGLIRCCVKNEKQAGAELGQAQPKLGLKIKLKF